MSKNMFCGTFELLVHQNSKAGISSWSLRPQYYSTSKKLQFEDLKGEVTFFDLGEVALELIEDSKFLISSGVIELPETQSKFST